ncbi:MAG: methyl-accepting chemotaxis protein [Gammaproteobacteria bacterium]
MLKYLSWGTGAGFLLVSLIFSAAIWYQERLIEDFKHLLQQDVHQQQLIMETNLLFKTQVQEWKNVLLRGRDDKARDKYWQAFQSVEAEVQSKAQQLAQTLPPGPARDKVSAFASSHQTMARAYRDGFEKFRTAGFDHLAGDAAVKGIDREPAKLLQESVELITADTTAFASQTEQAAQQIVQVMLPVVFVLVLAIAATVMLLLRNQVVNPLQELILSIQHFATGDFRNQIRVEAKGEIGALANDIRAMQRNLSSMIEHLNQGATTLEDTARQFHSLTDTSLQQSDAVQQRADLVATAANEMSSSALQVAQSASGARDAAQQADVGARGSLGVVNETITSINLLAGDVQQVADAMHRLTQDTARIGNVLDVIKGIAEQTNLLALNAAIEAARAGEQGRGFAVVADEVRTLAQRTQSSTEEIHQMISNVQSGTRDAVQAMQKSQERTQQSVSLSQKAGESITAINAAIEAIKQMNTQIAAAAEEQSAVSEDINSNIRNVALTRPAHPRRPAENSRRAEQSAAGHFGQLIRNLTGRRFEIPRDSTGRIHTSTRRLRSAWGERGSATSTASPARVSSRTAHSCWRNAQRTFCALRYCR